MENKFTFKTLLHLLFLELLSLSPLFILLGNIIPPIPLKFHHIAFGLVFLISFILILRDINKRWIAYLFLFYLFFQYYLDALDIPAIIDFFFGPFALLVMMDLVANKRLPLSNLKRYFQRFYFLLWIPMLIALLQYIDLMPLQYWNATYVNYTVINDEAIARSNGLLFHGSELSVLMIMTTLLSFFYKKSHIGLIIFIFIIAYTTLYKALLISLFILILYYLFVLKKDIVSWWWKNAKHYIILFSAIIIFLLLKISYDYFKTINTLSGYFFVPEILTGRGTIWNIYIDAIKEFSNLKIAVGNGIGSAKALFRDYATTENFAVLRSDPKSEIAYDTHNTLLSIFVNSGLVGIVFFTYLLYVFYKKNMKSTPSLNWNKRAFIAVIIIPLLTIGMTIPIFKMAIYWSSLCFIFFKWNHFRQSFDQ